MLILPSVCSDLTHRHRRVNLPFCPCRGTSVKAPTVTQSSSIWEQLSAFIGFVPRCCSGRAESLGGMAVSSELCQHVHTRLGFCTNVFLCFKVHVWRRQLCNVVLLHIALRSRRCLLSQDRLARLICCLHIDVPTVWIPFWKRCCSPAGSPLFSILQWRGHWSGLKAVWTEGREAVPPTCPSPYPVCFAGTLSWVGEMTRSTLELAVLSLLQSALPAHEMSTKSLHVKIHNATNFSK